MRAHCDAAGTAARALVGLLVGLGTTVAVPCAVFVAALSLCLWALLMAEKANALAVAACHNITPGCALAALQHSRNVLARLFAVSFLLFFVLLVLGSDDDEDDNDGLEEEVREVRRGRQASASTGLRLVRRPPRSRAARETSAEHVREIAPGTAGPSSPPVLPGTGRSAMSPTRAPPSRSAPQGPDASHGRSASPYRRNSSSTGPLWNLHDAVLVSLSRKFSGPEGGARRRRWSPTGTSRRTSPTGTSRRTSPTGTSRRTSPTGTSRRGVSSGSLFYENVVLRQLRDQAHDELSADDQRGDS